MTQFLWIDLCRLSTSLSASFGRLCPWRNWPISLNYQICGHRAAHIFLYYPFNVHGITSDFYLLSLVILARSLPVLLNISSQTSFWFCWFSWIFFFLAVPSGLWDLSSLTRVWTQVLSRERMESFSTESPRNPQIPVFNFIDFCSKFLSFSFLLLTWDLYCSFFPVVSSGGGLDD